MTQKITLSPTSKLPSARQEFLLPGLIAHAGEKAQMRFWEFFTVNIRNPHTRRAYYNGVAQFFTWCSQHGIELEGIQPMIVAAYIEELQKTVSKPTVKQHLAAIRMLFDWMIVGQIIPYNPASAVRGPKYVVKKGKTPVLEASDTRTLLDSIDTSHVVGLRDRALITVMTFSFARISAVLAMNVGDYYPTGGHRMMLRLREKGGKLHEVPAHHTINEYLAAYLESSELTDTKAPLFQSTRGQSRKLTGKRFDQSSAWYMIRRRCVDAGINIDVCNHTFRATGITNFLANGGKIEDAAAIAGHESPRTTKLYDRTGEKITLDEIERVRI